jgi:IclR family KDG regulon transcriptional repressor
MAKNNQQLATVTKSLELLELVAKSRMGLSLTEIAKAMELPKSSVIRYLRTLERKEFIERDELTQRYLLGPGPLRLVSHDSRQGDLRRAAYPLLLQLRESSGETVNLAVPMGNKVVYVESMQSSHPVRTVRQVGEESPLHATAVGKAVLAFFPPQQLESLKSNALRQYTDRTITVWPTLLRELEKVRKQGFAIDDREGHREFRCVGAPIFDHRSQVIASIAISGPANRLTLERALDLGPVVASTAKEISSRLGFEPERDP